MTSRSAGFRHLLPLLFVAAGAGAAFLARQDPPSAAPPLPVEVTTAPPADGPVHVQARGTLAPTRQVTVRAEVAGRVARIAPDLSPGARFPAGAELAAIDDRDYRLALQQRQAEVDRARSELDLEQGRRAVAKHEWALLGADAPAGGRDLALRQPQQRSARAGLSAARGALDQAKLALERTRLVAPFDAEVVAAFVDVGHVVRAGQDVATLVGTEAWWAQVTLPAAELAWLDVPGARATVTQDQGGRAVTRTGRAVRLVSDATGTRVLVQVDDPLGLKTAAPPLLLGTPVDVALEGHAATHVRAVPLAAVEGDAVWTVQKRHGRWTLQPRPVHVVHRERDRVLVRAGDLAEDARVVAGPLTAPAPRMTVRPIERRPDAELGGS
jgi:RND family efflux transporter MFP subunit